MNRRAECEIRARRHGGWLAALLLVFLGTIAVSARADEPELGTPAVRLSDAEGSVQILVGGQLVVDQAMTNLPVSEESEIVTGADGRAEIQLEDGSVARITPNSALLLTSLRGTDGNELVLERGMGYFELQSNAGGGSTVRFGDSRVTVSEFSVLRIRADQLPGELTTFSGRARLEFGHQQTIDLLGHEDMVLNAADPRRYWLSDTIDPDSWDEWNADRDQALNEMASAQTSASSSYATGDAPNPAWSDLDANGSWYNVPGQGYIWSPTAGSNPNWEPYGCGRWVWTPQWGYIWVSCESWGFMPYRCGSWSFFDSFGWGWSPAGGCGNHWGMGSFGSVRILRGPRGYLPIQRPISPIRRFPRGDRPAPIFVNRPNPVGGRLPERDRSSFVIIGGQQLRPMERLHDDHGDNRHENGFWGRGVTDSWSHPQPVRPGGDAGFRPNQNPQGGNNGWNRNRGNEPGQQSGPQPGAPSSRPTFDSSFRQNHPTPQGGNQPGNNNGARPGSQTAPANQPPTGQNFNRPNQPTMPPVQNNLQPTHNTNTVPSQPAQPNIQPQHNAQPSQPANQPQRFTQPASQPQHFSQPSQPASQPQHFSQPSSAPAGGGAPHMSAPAPASSAPAPAHK
jgi:hypothetical protein